MKLGYEVSSGEVAEIEPAHLIVTGLTQQSGKTTTLEALITRSGSKAIVFRTKPGERGFIEGNRTLPYFKEKSDWQYVASLLEATLKEKLRFERSWIMNVCKNTSSLIEVKRNIEQQLANPKVTGLNRGVYTTLDEYLNLIMPQLSVTVFTNVLELQPGINVMNLERLKEELQSLVIRSVLETVLIEMHDTIVVIPEAWKFLPQERGNPCKEAAEKFIRQGATNNNFLWIDSQDIAGIDKTPLKSVSTWILGVQTEINEVRHTLNQMPTSKKLRPKEDEIMRLPLGHFYLCTRTGSKKVYVQPSWLDDETAIKIAKGEMEIPQGKKAEFELKKLRLDLAPKPILNKLQDNSVSPIYKKLVDEINEMREDFFSKLQEFYEFYVILSNNVANMKPEINEDAIISKLLQKVKIPSPINNLQQQPIDIDKITAQILERIPKQAGSVIYEVSPLEKIKKDFLEEAKQKVLSELNQLSEKQKKLVKFLEVQQKGLKYNAIVVHCFHLAEGGPNTQMVREFVRELDAKKIVKFDNRVSITYPSLKEMIKNYLQPHEADETEIDLLYNHILNELL